MVNSMVQTPKGKEGDTLAPKTLEAALASLAQEGAIPYAGGTDLMVAEDERRPFLFLHNIAELQGFSEDDEYYRLGAGLTYTRIMNDKRMPALLVEAASQIAAPAIRNAGTIGGNIANASPKADSALVLVATDSLVRLVSAAGERVIPIGQFLVGRQKTTRRPDELLVEILMPKRWLADYRFTKVGGRKALAISRVSFAGLFAAESGVIQHLALAFGAVEDTIVRRPQIDGLLIGKSVEEARALSEEWLAAWDAAITPLRGRVSARYRKQVCLNLAAAFLKSRLESTD